MRTRFTDLVGVQKPLMQGGMQWLGHAELAAAVSNAGGLGLLTALTQPTPEALHDEVRRARDLTDQPLGMNLTTLPSINQPPYDEYRDAGIEAGIDVIETSGSDPTGVVPGYHAAEVTVIHKVTSVRHALKAAAAGVDAVIVDGFECAGHPGEDDVPGLVLVPAVVDALARATRDNALAHCPVVLAAGGIADGRGLAAALSLGAEGVVMGTRFMATAEARLHPRVKQAIIDHDEHDTTLIFRELRNTARVARNAVAEQVAAITAAGGDFAAVRELVAGSRGRTVYETGDLDAGIWWAGLAQALVHDVPTCETLLERIVDEATEVVENRLSLMLTA